MIATILNVHSSVECGLDTLDSIKTYVGDNVVLLVDGLNWNDWKDVENTCKLKGFRHGIPKSPYRNVALGLKEAYEMWGNEVDWFFYTEYDALVTSERFKINLKMAEEKGIWMLGNDGHVAGEAITLIQAMLGESFRSSYYLLGCCQFFHKDFMKKLADINFFERFLNLTNGFSDGYFPFYSGYDLSEHMYPTLCRHFGGNIGVFAHFDELKKWHGSYQYFPVRWKPEIDFETENFPNPSIIHPLKENSHPLRVLHRERRNQWKNFKKKESQLDSFLMSQSDMPKTDDVLLIH